MKSDYLGPVLAAAVLLTGFAAQAESGTCVQGVAALQARHARTDSGGLAYLADGAKMDALRALEEEAFGVIADCREHAGAYVLMGEIQLSLGQVSLAVAYARRAVGLDPNAWRAQQLLGSTLGMVGQAEEGLAHLERAMWLEPGNERLRLNHASALLAAGRVAEARARCEALTGSGDRQVAGLAWQLCGQVRLRGGEVEAAGEAFVNARRLGIHARERLVDSSAEQRYLDAVPATTANGRGD